MALAVEIDVVVVKAVTVLKATVVIEVLDVKVAVEETLPMKRTSVFVTVAVTVFRETGVGSVTVTAGRWTTVVEIFLICSTTLPSQ